MSVIQRPHKLSGFMNNFQIFIRNGWLALERVVSRSPDPDSVFANAGNQIVVGQAAKTLNKSNRPSAAQCDDWPIPVLNRLTIVLSNCRKSRTVDRCVRLRRQAAVNVADDQIILPCCLKRHDGGFQGNSEAAQADFVEHNMDQSRGKNLPVFSV